MNVLVVWGVGNLSKTDGLPVKILAIVGGGLIGAILVGILLGFLSRAMTLRQLPPWPNRILRLGGGILAAWLVYLWVFGPGGGGGGPGGPLAGGSGGRNGKEKETTSSSLVPKTEKTTEEDKIGKVKKQPTVLRAQVLTVQAAEKRAGRQAVDEKRRYHLEGDDPSRLLKLEDVVAEIRKRKQDDPPLERLEIIESSDPRDSAGKLTPPVSALKAWGKKEGLAVAYVERKRS